MSYRPLWTCPRCGRTFANVNQTHTCAALGSVHAHFDGKDPAVRAAFERVLAALAPLGPVDVLAEWSTDRAASRRRGVRRGSARAPPALTTAGDITAQLV